MSGSRSSTPALLVPAWVLASLVAAVCAHAGIDALGGLLGGDADAYAGRAHVAVVPAVVLAAGLLAGGFLRVAAGVLAHREGGDPIELLARRFGAMRPARPLVAVACGAFAALTGMEFCEQFASAGRIEGFADALGGTPALGVMVLLAASFAVTLAGLRTASALVTTARTLARVVFERFAWAVVRLGRAVVHALRTTQRRPAGLRAARLARGRGLRAPPAAA